MRAGQFSPLVPKGLLIVGPQGTDKQIIAEIIAEESGFNLMRLRFTKDKSSKFSKRDLDIAICIAKDLYPAIIFVDEADQILLGGSGDHATISASILEELDNTVNRGYILWVVATNQPELLDEALLRCFDRIILLHAPNVERACMLLATMPRKLNRQGDYLVGVEYSGDLAQSNDMTNIRRPLPTSEDLNRFYKIATEVVKRGLMDIEIERVVRYAAEITAEESLDRLREYPSGIESHHLLESVRKFQRSRYNFQPDYQKFLAPYSALILSDLPDSHFSENSSAVRNQAHHLPLKLFYCYAPEDEELLHELEAHLSRFYRQSLITSWYKGKILPGMEWEKERIAHLNTSDIILLLVSPQFFASYNCYNIEMKCALERSNAGEAHIIPVILRAVDWEAMFGNLHILPPDGKPITSWSNRDEAFREVAKGIGWVVDELLRQKIKNNPPKTEEHFDQG